MLKPSPPEYKEIEKRLFLEFHANVIDELNAGNKNLNRRIETFCKNFRFEKSKVEQKIRDCNMFAAHFTKAPKRTKFHKKVAHDWLNQKLGLMVAPLHSRGKNAFFVTSNGEIKKINGRKPPSLRALDFMWGKNGNIFYAMHKYTEGTGGAQSQNSIQMETALKNFENNNDPNIVLIVIVDGSYYDEDRMRELNDFIQKTPPRSYAVHIEDVPAIMENY